MTDLNDWAACDRHETAYPRGEPCPECEQQCNCDQALALCGLLAEARDVIAEHAPMAAGIEWMEHLHRSPHFNDPEPPQ